MKLRTGWIYRARKGKHFDKKFNHFMITFPGDIDTKTCGFVDCIPCTEKGRHMPGYQVGIPIEVSRMVYSSGEPAF